MVRAKACLGWLLAALVFPAVTVKAAPATFSCAGLPDGDYQDSSSCSHYYSCNQGVATRQTCAPSTLFDASLGHCNWANQVKNCDITVTYSTMTTAHGVTPTSATTRLPIVTTASPISTTNGNSNNNACQTQCTGNYVCDESSGQCVCNNFYWGPLCENRKPHYVIIVIDDLGSTDVTWSPYHQQYSPDIETPNMENLTANEGVLLDNYYVDSVCTPSRSQLLFSVHPIFTNLQNFVIRGAQRNSVPTDVKSLADKLRGDGEDYRCYMQGKWHLGQFQDDVLPTRRGFHSYLGMVHGMSDHYTRVATEIFNCTSDDIFAGPCTPSSETPTCVTYTGTDLLDGVVPVTGSQLKTEKHSTDLLTDRFHSDLSDYLAFHNNKPLFMHLNYLANHYPLEAEPGYETQYWKDKRAAQGGILTSEQQLRSNYAAMLKHVDQRVSDIVQRLKNEGLWQHTILVVTNDNGGDPKNSGSNYPLRGSKFSLYQGGIKGVGFIASPYIDALRKAVPPAMSKQTSLLMHISDFYPTLLTLAGKANSIAQSNSVQYPTSGYTFWSNLSKPFSTTRNHILLNIDPLTPCHGPSTIIDSFDVRQRAGVLTDDGYKLLTGNPVTSNGYGGWCNTFEDPDCLDQIDPDAPEKNIRMFNLGTDFDERNDISDEEDALEHRTALINIIKEYQNKMVAANTLVKIFAQDTEANPTDGTWSPWANDPNNLGVYCSNPSPQVFNGICYQ